MKKITINKKEYTLVYSIEASLYDECTESVMNMFIKAGMGKGAAEENDTEAAVDALVETVANLPQRTLTLFYAALLEHHGPEGDGSIQGMSDAKKLLAEYLKEKKKSFRDVMEEMMDLMGKDHFFELIGLDKITSSLEEEVKSEVGANTSEQS